MGQEGQSKAYQTVLVGEELEELGASLFPYIVPVIPRLLPMELVKEEHFVLTDLFKSIPSSSSQAGFAQAEVTEGPLMKFVRPDQLPLAEQDPQPAPLGGEEEEKKKQRKVDRPRLTTQD